MDMKGQSALEYLMTYGWALIVIAIVIGVLIFVTSGATGGVVCQSSSTGIIVETQSITTTTAGVVLRNATGQTLDQQDVTGGGSFLTALAVDLTADANAAKNATFVVDNVVYDDALVSGATLQNATLAVNYNISGLAATATITCSGTV